MANGHYSPDSGPFSHLSVTITGIHGITSDVALPSAAKISVASITPEPASVAGFISTIANSHN
jgi:hypothetical protein